MSKPTIDLYGQKFPCLYEAESTPEIFPGYEIAQPVDRCRKSLTSTYPYYKPTNYTSLRILQKTAEQTADPLYVEPAIISKRLSLTGPLNYAEYLDPDGQTRSYPLNPRGRTGLRGRGACKNWGPIQAADALLTRFNSLNGLLELLVIKRADNNAWALPGGKVDSGEGHHQAALRELFEEALALDTTEKDINPHPPLASGQKPPFYFFNDEVVFEGVHAEPRNTDNAWYEGRVFHKNLDWNLAENLILRPSSDALEVKWLQLTPENIATLFADHSEIVRYALAKMEAQSEAKIKPLQQEIFEAIQIALGEQISPEDSPQSDSDHHDQAAQ